MPKERLVRFGPFIADLKTQELSRGKARLRIPGQSFQILALLLARPGALVTREELQEALWPADTFVDFDHGLSSAVKRLREVLGDSADSPRYVETLPRRGYRFVGKIQEEKAEDPGGDDSSQITQLPPSLKEARPVEAVSPTSRSHVWLVAASTLFLAALVAVLIVGIVRNQTLPADTAKPAVIPFTSDPGIETAPSFSPDSSRIAFAWSGSSAPNAPGYDLYVKGIGSEAQLQLTHHPSEWIASAWSPDGTRIAFHRLAGPDSGIYLISAMGGPERKLISTQVPYSVAAAITWSPDGKWIAFSNPANGEPKDRMFRISTETLEVVPFDHDPDCLHEANPTFSHDGQKIFYTCVHSVYSGDFRFRPVVGGTPTLIAAGPEPPHGMAVSGDDRRLVYSHGYAELKLSMVDLDDRSVKKIDAQDDASWPAISAQGDKLAFSAERGSIGIWQRDLLHPSAPASKVIPSSREQNSPQFSPDGKRIAFESKRDGAWALWVADRDGGNLLKLSGDVFGSGSPRWSPDGTKILFDTAAIRPSSIYVVDVAGGVPRKIQTQIADMKLPAWSRDGNWLYFASDTDSGQRAYRCSAQGGTAEQFATGVQATRPAESADGKYLYVTSRSSNIQLGKLSLKDPKSGVQLEPMPRVLGWTLWQLTSSGIYFVPHDAPRTMRYFEFATREIKDEFSIDKDFDDGISVSPDGRFLLYSQVDEVNADIMVMRKYH